MRELWFREIGRRSQMPRSWHLNPGPATSRTLSGHSDLYMVTLSWKTGGNWPLFDSTIHSPWSLCPQVPVDSC